MKKYILIIFIFLAAFKPVASQDPPWYFINTVHNHIVLVLETVPILIDTVPMVPGDYIGAFYTFNGAHVCGSGTGLTGDIGGMKLTGNANACTVWGAEPNVFNGFQAGEEFIWKVWRSSDGSIFDAVATYDIIALPDSGIYVDEGLSKLASLQAYSIPGLNLSVNSQSTPVSSCGYIDPQPVTIMLQNHDTLDIIGFDVFYTINGGDTVSEYVNDTLFAGGFYEYTFNTLVDLSQVGDYEFYVWVDHFGDVNNTNDYNRKLVVISDSPVVNIGADRVICNGDSAVLQADELYVDYIWSNGFDYQYIYVQEEGYYYLTITDQFGCNGVDSMYLTVYPEPQTNLPEEVFICEGGYTNVAIIERFKEIEWSNGSLKPNLYITFPGTYTVTVTDFAGCAAIDSLLVTEIPLPTPNLGEDIYTSVPDTVLINAGPGFDDFYWSIGDTTQVIQPGHFGTFSVTVSTNGCEGSDEINIFEADTITYPTLFNVFPNPVVNEITIRFPFADEVYVDIYNSLGQFIDAWDFKNSYEETVDVTNMKQGFYVMYVKADENYYKKKFLIVN